jgi:hypothetical protein
MEMQRWLVRLPPSVSTARFFTSAKRRLLHGQPGLYRHGHIRRGIAFEIFVDPKGNELWLIQTAPAAVPAVFEGKVTRVSR